MISNTALLLIYSDHSISLALFKMISFIKYYSVDIATTVIKQNILNFLLEYDSKNIILRRHSCFSAGLRSESIKAIRQYYDSSQVKER